MTVKEKRSAFMADVRTFYNSFDPSGTNYKQIEDELNAKSDTEFNSWLIDFLSDDSQNFYREIEEFHNDLTMDMIEKTAKKFKIPLYEKVAIPYLNEDADNATVTPEPVPVGYLHIKRQVQALTKKNAMSISIDKRSAITGQVTGKDKNAKITDNETFGLLTVGAKEALREFMGPRADAIKPKMEMEAKIAKDGFVRLADIKMGSKYQVSTKYFDALMKLGGFDTNLIEPLGVLVSSDDDV